VKVNTEPTASSQKSPGRPKGSNKGASKARILIAARKQFADNGYSQTTFKDIGKCVGVTSAAVYNYFPSKSALFSAACDDAQGILLKHIHEDVHGHSDLREQLGSFLRIAAKVHEDDSSVTELLGSIPLEVRRHPELAALLLDRQNVTLRFMVDAFSDAQERGEIRLDATPAELVEVFLGATVGVALFQFGLKRQSLVQTMEIFIEILETQLFVEEN
jgi:AcrR family transcriptional regulator